MTIAENIPKELREMSQWVCTRGDSKVPMKAWEDEAASSTNPLTWSSFPIANDAVEQGYYDYCGFVFADNGLVGIDIDTGVDEDGFLTPLASDIISKCTSYTEKSKSGRGFHIILKGDLPFKGKNNLAGVEIYKTARFFIITGDTVLYRHIEENQEAIDYVLEKYFPETRQEKGNFNNGERIYLPVWESPKGRRVKVRPTYPRIPDGNRNLCLTSLAGTLHNAGYTKAQIYEEIKYCNSVACEPPLDNNELRTICNSVVRYRR